MKREHAESYASMVTAARTLKENAKALEERAALLHDIVLQEMLDDMLSSVRVAQGTLFIDRQVWAQYRNNDAQSAIEIVHRDIPELRSVNHQQATYMLRRILDEKGGEWFNEPRDAFSTAFEPSWATKLIVRRTQRDK